MYRFELTDRYLSRSEQDRFRDYLDFCSLDRNIWEVFASLFASSTSHTTPLVLRAYAGGDLVGAAIVIRCTRYGRALFDYGLLSRLIDFVRVPFYLWIKFGCCMDMMSNPGFVSDPAESSEVIKGMAGYLRDNTLLTIINDYTENAGLHDGASTLPALPHALIDTSSMESIEDYLKLHKNIGHKLRVFRRKGGEYTRIDRRLDGAQIASLEKCFLATTEKSIFYLPYQHLYLKSAMETSRRSIDDVHYFVATINGAFVGYQAAVKTGSNLNALHGAFDRSLQTTHHAYDVLFVKMTEFALEHGLKTIDYGAVLNRTKQKMINKSIDLSYYLTSRHATVQKSFDAFLKRTKVQGKEQLKYRNADDP